MRSSALCALGAAVLVGTIGSAAFAGSFPARLELPDGWAPEGIATGRGHELFVGSIPTGAVRRIDARTGESSTAVPARSGRSAIGLKVDQHERLFVAGGGTGRGFVYDAETGADLAQFQFAAAGPGTFVNDVALTREAAYFTDSRRMVLYVVATDLGGFSELPLPDIPPGAGNNLNGIVATPDGDTLLAVQSNAGRLWRIDPATGAATAVDLGGETLTNGDGLLLAGHTLYVVQNRLNRVAVFRLEPGFGSGELVDRITSADFDVPTTLARFGDRLYAVNARFGTTDPQPADYWVTRLRR